MNNINSTSNSNPVITTESINKITPQFDFYKDFEMRELLENQISSIEPNNQIKKSENLQENENMELIIKSFPLINDNIRANILLSIEIYKKINNFDSKYIHEFINSKSIKK